METVKEFLQKRNKMIKERFVVLKKTMKRDEALQAVATEFELSTASINTIVYRASRPKSSLQKLSHF
jgi:hypothetical protein